MIELERTFLAKTIPDLSNCEKKEVIDIYIPKESRHPVVRIRKNGDRYEMTKKCPVGECKSEQEEQTIILDEAEFEALMQLEGKKVSKIRYYYDYEGRRAEIDVFTDALKGLVLVDFEFDNREEMEKFEMPDFCLADISQEEFVAGGMLCGKSYADIEQDLERFGYKRL